jgi:NAD(P)H-quinone oxidoreductase subunit 4
VAIGCYPKVAMQTYDTQTVAINRLSIQAYADAYETRGLGNNAQVIPNPVATLSDRSN